MKRTLFLSLSILAAAMPFNSKADLTDVGTAAAALGDVIIQTTRENYAALKGISAELLKQGKAQLPVIGNAITATGSKVMQSLATHAKDVANWTASSPKNAIAASILTVYVSALAYILYKAVQTPKKVKRIYHQEPYCYEQI